VLTSFIGRAEPLSEVAGLLSDHRLVTVTGPGGAGKTRLAVQVARQVAARFADGAWLVELAPVADPAQMAAVVAASLGVREQPGLSAAEALARALARQQQLHAVDLRAAAVFAFSGHPRRAAHGRSLGCETRLPH
jgi:predicted ATPase